MRRRALVAVTLLVALVVGFGVGNSRSQPGGRTRAAAHVAHQPPSDSGEPAAGRVAEGGDPSETGARAAAIAYATASQDWLYLSDEDVERSVTAIATPAAGPQLSQETVTELRAARDALAKSPGRVWWVVRPLASRVERFDRQTARVVVWTVTVLSASDVALPQADWMRVAIDLARVDGEWRVQAIAEVPGPTPMTGTKDRPWQPEPFDTALEGFERVNSEARE